MLTRDPQEAVGDAIRDGDVATVARLLERGARKDGMDAGGFTPLMRAARAGNLAIVRMLLERGANVNARSPDSGATALLHALDARTLDVELISTLLDAGADVTVADAYGTTPLRHASSRLAGARTALALLRERHGALGGVPDGSSPVRVALGAQILRLIAADEPMPDHEAGARTTSLRAPSRDERASILEEVCTRLRSPALRAHVDAVRFCPGQPEPLVVIAAEHGLVAVLDALVEAGATVDPLPIAHGLYTRVPLVAAVRAGHVDIVDRLIAAGADLAADRNAPLRTAVAIGDVDMVEMLLAAGADPTRDVPASTALRGLHAEQIRSLLSECPSTPAQQTGERGVIYVGEEPPIDVPRARGVEDFLAEARGFGNGEYCVGLVRANATVVARTMAEVWGTNLWQRDVRRQAIAGWDDAVLMFQLRHSNWTVVPFGVGHLYGPMSAIEGALMKLSSILDTQSILLWEDDTECVIHVDVYERGGHRFTWKSSELEGHLAPRKHRSPSSSYSEVKCSQILAEHDVYIPGCRYVYPHSGRWKQLALEGVSEDDVIAVCAVWLS